jgi:hypothetical protein
MRIFAKLTIHLPTRRGNNDAFFYDASAWLMNLKTGKMQPVKGAVSLRPHHVSIVEKMAGNKDQVIVSVIGSAGSYIIPPGLLDEVGDGYFWVVVADVL